MVTNFAVYVYMIYSAPILNQLLQKKWIAKKGKKYVREI